MELRVHHQIEHWKRQSKIPSNAENNFVIIFLFQIIVFSLFSQNAFNKLYIYKEKFVVLFHKL